MASLAETLRQVGYVTPQGVTGPNAPLAQQLKNYATNVIPTARQNLAQQRADIDAALTMGQGGVEVGDKVAFERALEQVPNFAGTTLKSVVEPIQAKGVVLDIYEANKNPNKLFLSKIEVPKEMRKQGVGSEVMQQLSEFADQQGKTIALSPSTDFGASSVSRLKDFYKRFGFIENKGRNKDFSISESMYRLPSQPSRKEIIEQELKKVVE
jgi:predicted GNAT family acetyltransferase